MEIKEWQAIMEYLNNLPKKNDQGVCLLALDKQAEEHRAINVHAQE